MISVMQSSAPQEPQNDDGEDLGGKESKYFILGKALHEFEEEGQTA